MRGTRLQFIKLSGAFWLLLRSLKTSLQRLKLCRKIDFFFFFFNVVYRKKKTEQCPPVFMRKSQTENIN